MKLASVALASCLLPFAVACSHAESKPAESPGASMAARSRPPRPRVQEPPTSEDTTTARRDDAGDAIFFDFNSATISNDARPILQSLGKQLAHNRKTVRIEGNCDERGTTEYNLALGDRRAREAKQYLERLGIPDRRISVVSYGSERPKYEGHDESAWAKNRRDDFKIQ